MQKQLTALATILLLSVATQAYAETNVIELLDDANLDGNVIEMNITGDNNSLSLTQDFALGAWGENLMDITIDGNKQRAAPMVPSFRVWRSKVGCSREN
ncbi:hypothetical protein [uncultured Cohaesibacter sp.]|uniref:hypothetical protein n=1 Tax=uncultured Cohaesibacter sp. TaxID=1002546 RepID=UPI0029C7C533|nr:hypothetical protein [uncultured Cohaesibacter sp.]